MTHGLAYMRTSSAAHVGGDSDVRQRLAIEGYARANGVEIAAGDWYYDAAVSGADAVTERPGFQAMLTRITANGVRLVIVEDASRFARELMVQEAGIAMLIAAGVRLVTASGEDLTASDQPERVMIRQMLGAVAQFQKAQLVAKLRGARDRASASKGRRIEGRPGHAELRPDLVARVLHLRAKGLTVRAIADALAAEGVVTSNGRPMHFTGVSRMLKLTAIRASAGLAT